MKMINQILHGMLMVLLVTFAACTAKKEETVVSPVDKEQIKQMIQDKENHYAELYTKGDLGKIDYYADDAIVFAQNKKMLVGKDSIQAYLKQGLEASSPGNKMS